MGIFSACIIALGIYPKPLLTLIDSGVKPVLETMAARTQVSSSKILLTTLASKQDRALDQIKSFDLMGEYSAEMLDSTQAIESSQLESSPAQQSTPLLFGE